MVQLVHINVNWFINPEGGSRINKNLHMCSYLIGYKLLQFELSLNYILIEPRVHILPKDKASFYLISLKSKSVECLTTL
jgi:hypothetical protein